MSTQPPKGVGQGKITAGIKPGTLVSRTIEFVYAQLPCWRDDPDRQPENGEERLNAQLCKFLDVAAREAFPMVYFHHEERQTGRRRVDLSALPTETIWVGHRPYTIYDPILVIEGKRLPAPSADRQKEYVTGLDNRSGGIQRFKLGLHGAQLDRGVIVAYIQKDGPASWHATINEWILALASGGFRDVCSWTAEETLRRLTDDVRSKAARCLSSHQRTSFAHRCAIILEHLWVVM